MPTAIPQIFAHYLQNIEPDATFTMSAPNVVTSSSGTRYFAKIGSASEQEQFTGEAESLRELHTAAPELGPKVIASGLILGHGDERPSAKGDPFFLSEYKDIGSLTNKSAEILGRRLATEVHAYKGGHGFGFAVPTFCGATRMANGWFSTWEECYDNLIGGLLLQLKKQGGFSALCDQAEKVREK